MDLTENLYIIDAIAVSVFLVSYYRNCYRRGYRLDIWHLMLFQVCILTNLILVPFEANDLNLLTLRELWLGTRDHIADAFIISLVGYVAVIVGGALWRRKDDPAGPGAGKGLLAIVPRQSQLLMSDPGILAIQAAICMVLEIWILSLYFAASGFGFDLRLYTFEHSSLRPVAIIISNYSVFIGSHCFARYIDTKERPMLVYAVLLGGGLIFFGSRTNLLLVYFMPVVCYLMYLRTRLNLVKLILMAVLLVSVFIFGAGLRGGSDVSSASRLPSLVFETLFGNTFSDLRDLALVLSGWNGQFWMGRTYLSALMGFVPRSLSAFRGTWSLGVMTSTMVGLDPDVHSGVRPGFFGESYFNFGYTGVVLMGLFIGRVVRKVDICVKRELETPSPSIMRAFSYTVLLTVMTNIALSAGMATTFVLVGVFTVSGICRNLQRTAPRPA